MTCSISSSRLAFGLPGSGQSSRSLSITKVSDIEGGIGSLATSAVPILANTRRTSGKPANFVSSASCIATDWLRLVPGIRIACTVTSPSSRLGMNSLPKRVASSPHNTVSTAAPAITGTRRRNALCNTGS